MAEQVQAMLDGMVIPLLDLQERQIFTSDEIRHIVDKRRQYEYLLLRRQVRKSDYLSYLQSEIHLERLRKLRTRRQLLHHRRQDEEDNNKAKQQQRDGSTATRSAMTTNHTNNTKHVGDKHIQQHIHLLWKRTLQKFRSDKALYLQYADYLSQQSAGDVGRGAGASAGGAGGPGSASCRRRLGQLYTQALQVFPHETMFWIEAASFEFFHNLSIQQARVLLQRGLRVNPTAQDLWTQYLALELHWVQKVKGRAKLLLLQSEPIASSDAVTTAVVAKGPADSGPLSPSSDQHDSDYTVARIVIDHGVEAILKQQQQQQQSSTDTERSKTQNEAVSLCDGFLEQCVLFPDTYTLQQHIIQDWLKDRINTPSAWLKVAAFQWRQEQQQQQHQQQQENEQTKGQQHDDKKKGWPVLETIQEAVRRCSCHGGMLEAALEFVQGYYREMSSGLHQDAVTISQQAEACRELMRDLLEQMRKSNWYQQNGQVPSIILIHFKYLVEIGKEDEAIQLLRDVLTNSNHDKTSAEGSRGFSMPLQYRTGQVNLWLHWADLVTKRQSLNDAVSILAQALEATPMDHPDFMVALLQLIGAQLLSASQGSRLEYHEPLQLLMERLILLAPGFADSPPLDDPPFGVVSVWDACLQSLDHVVRRGASMAEIRKLYTSVLYQSSLATDPSWRNGSNLVLIKHFVDAAIEAEQRDLASVVGQPHKSSNTSRHPLGQLFEAALQIFRRTPMFDAYKKRRDDQFTYGTLKIPEQHAMGKSKLGKWELPSFSTADQDFSWERLMVAFKTYQVVHLTHIAKEQDTRKTLTWNDISGLFQRLDSKDQSSWCIERSPNGPDLAPEHFLDPTTSLGRRGYCSFLVQSDKRMLDETLDRLPVDDLFGKGTLVYEPALWFFFGRNPLGNLNLQGRPEHTDSVSHDGTWHFQLSGRKVWLLRPTPELLTTLAFRASATSPIRLECKEGEAIVINTRLWFHQTIIPPQRNPSVSYARDFRLSTAQAKVDDSAGAMTNLDGLYATEDIEEGTILFKESDMPDCELHRSSGATANCELVVLDDGTEAVVSCRPIKAGEFFCMPDTTDDESEEDVNEGPSDLDEKES